MISFYIFPVLALTVFFTGVTEFMVSPMLTPLADAFNVTPAQASWLIAVYTLTYAVAAPVLGKLSDRISRYRMLNAALLLFVADGAALVLADHFGWYTPFLLSAAGSLIMWIACQFLFHGVSRGSSQPVICPACPRYSPALLWLIAAKGLWNGTVVVMFVLSGELLRNRFALNTAMIGFISGIFGIGLLLGNIFLPLFRRLCGTDARLLLISLIVMSAMIAGFISGTGGLSTMMLWMLLQGCALGIAAPVSTAIMAGLAGARKGEVLALSESMNNLSIFILLPVAAAQPEHQMLLPVVMTVLCCTTVLTGYILRPVFCKKS